MRAVPRRTFVSANQPATQRRLVGTMAPANRHPESPAHSHPDRARPDPAGLEIDFGKVRALAERLVREGYVDSHHDAVPLALRIFAAADAARRPNTSG
jgi:hypothetical protein